MGFFFFAPLQSHEVQGQCVSNNGSISYTIFRNVAIQCTWLKAEEKKIWKLVVIKK